MTVLPLDLRAYADNGDEIALTTTEWRLVSVLFWTRRTVGARELAARSGCGSVSATRNAVARVRTKLGQATIQTTEAGYIWQGGA